MTDHPKTLLLTTNRTEDGAPVYAPCGDLRELIAKWLKRADEMDDGSGVTRCAEAAADYRRRVAELETALHPSGDLLVARPLQIGVSYPKDKE